MKTLNVMTQNNEIQDGFLDVIYGTEQNTMALAKEEEEKEEDEDEEDFEEEDEEEVEEQEEE